LVVEGTPASIVTFDGTESEMYLRPHQVDLRYVDLIQARMECTNGGDRVQRVSDVRSRVSATGRQTLFGLRGDGSGTSIVEHSLFVDAQVRLAGLRLANSELQRTELIVSGDTAAYAERACTGDRSRVADVVTSDNVIDRAGGRTGIAIHVDR